MLKFAELDPKEFEAFAYSAHGHNFLQSSDFAAVRAERGAAPKFYAVKKGDKIILAGLCGLYGNSIDCLYGPVGEVTPEVIRAWTDGLRAEATRLNKIFISLDPFFPSSATSDWQSAGWQKLRRGKEGRIAAIAARPLPASYDEFLSSLDRKMRYEVRRSAKNGLVLRDLAYDELSILEEILQASADRQHFSAADLKYLQAFYRAFEHSRGYNVRFVVVEAPVASSGAVKAAPTDDLAVGASPAITGGIFVFSKLETVHFLGGNTERSLELGGMYFLLDAMIRDTIHQKIPRFNFFGVAGKDDPKITFKRKWGGEVEECMGVWVLPVNKPKFFAWKLKQLL
ncbi:aminoacyltransferase [Candidatus Saccharibacteria bacterium]|nr:aminoacyltransferase [Candidatus Saccharibacteria bacterium]